MNGVALPRLSRKESVTVQPTDAKVIACGNRAVKLGSVGSIRLRSGWRHSAKIVEKRKNLSPNQGKGSRPLFPQLRHDRQFSHSVVIRDSEKTALLYPMS